MAAIRVMDLLFRVAWYMRTIYKDIARLEML